MPHTQLLTISQKNLTVAILLAVFFGYLGLDRFYVGDVRMGLLKLFTLGGLGILWVYDIFTMSKRIEIYNRMAGQKLLESLREMSTILELSSPEFFWTQNSTIGNV